MVTNTIINIDLPNVTNILTIYKTRFEELLKRKLMDKGNVASGNLLASIHTRLETNDSVFEVWLDCLNYLKFLETGTKPHWPPSEPILKWVRNKKLPTRELTGDSSLPTEKQLTFLVQRKISEEGTKKYTPYSETLEELNMEFIPLIEEALRKDVEIYLVAMELHYELKMEI